MATCDQKLFGVLDWTFCPSLNFMEITKIQIKEPSSVTGVKPLFQFSLCLYKKDNKPCYDDDYYYDHIGNNKSKCKQIFKIKFQAMVKQKQTIVVEIMN